MIQNECQKRFEMVLQKQKAARIDFSAIPEISSDEETDKANDTSMRSSYSDNQNTNQIFSQYGAKTKKRIKQLRGDLEKRLNEMESHLEEQYIKKKNAEDEIQSHIVPFFAMLESKLNS